MWSWVPFPLRIRAWRRAPTMPSGSSAACWGLPSWPPFLRATAAISARRPSLTACARPRGSVRLWSVSALWPPPPFRGAVGPRARRRAVGRGHVGGIEPEAEIVNPWVSRHKALPFAEFLGTGTRGADIERERRPMHNLCTALRTGGRSSSGALAPNRPRTRSTQSAAHAATGRRSASLKVCGDPTIRPHAAISYSTILATDH